MSARYRTIMHFERKTIQCNIEIKAVLNLETNIFRASLAKTISAYRCLFTRI